MSAKLDSKIPIENQAESNSELEDITKVLETVNNGNAETEIDTIINTAPAPQNFELSKMFEPVVEREYATNPEAQLNKISGIENVKNHSESIPKENEQEKKPLFNFFKKEEVKQEPTIENVEVPSPEVQVPTMQFQEPIDPNLTASQNLTGQMGVTTSELIWNNFEHGLPELMGTYVVKISDSVVEDPIIDEATQLALKEDIAKRNKENKDRFIIPEWYKDQIKKPLQALCVEKGIETSIPVGVQLAIGVVIMLALFLIPTILEVKKSNELYLKRLDSHFAALRKEVKSSESKVESTEKKE
ncbi:MAG: hypothetical protein RLZZ175_2273 [Bacteroidota bacterium]|jgi:hypothetical protein